MINATRFTIPIGIRGEHVICAAIQQPNGIIFTGKRHNNCIGAAIDAGEPRPISGEHGFITSFGKFVTREEAAEIALKCGQIMEPTNRLFSEDVW